MDTTPDDLRQYPFREAWDWAHGLADDELRGWYRRIAPGRPDVPVADLARLMATARFWDDTGPCDEDDAWLGILTAAPVPVGGGCEPGAADLTPEVRAWGRQALTLRSAAHVRFCPNACGRDCTT